MPASDCGLFGLMPSRGVVPYGPDGDALEISRAHVLTRSVRDSAAILDASGASAGGYLRAVTEPADARLRVAFAVDSPSGVAVSEKCKSATRLAAGLCEQLGHHVEEVAPPVSIEPILGAAPLLRRLRLKLEADARNLGRDLSAESFEKTTWAILEYASTVSDAQYQTALACIDEVARALASFFKRYDVLLTPVLVNTPVPLGTFDMNRMSFDEYMTRLYVEHMPFTRQFNFSGGPAMSVPMDVTDDRLPIGVQFAADVGRDALLFALAAQIERARPWRCEPLLAQKRVS
jgi:Asp-tRNA(Asn)/Glu-tRNA(Gln) amidotransferase A subunit family amidase